MRSLKKVLSLVLALVFVIALATIGASAAYTDDDSITFTDAVATTSALGIFNGYEDGSFNPGGSITRQEAAKMIAMALNGGTFDPTLYTDASFFTDVDGLWGEGYINYLAGINVLAGVGDGTFNPQGNITAQELAKILLVALGYPSDLFTGANWALYTNRVATSTQPESLYEDYTGAYSKALTREEAALIIYNALLTNCVQAAWAGSNADAGITDLNSWTWTSTGKTFLETKFKCTANLGFVTATSDEFTELTGTDVVVSYSNTTIATDTKYKEDFLDGNLAATDKVASFDGSLGDPVTVYVDSKTKAVIAVAARTIEENSEETSNITYSTTASVKASAMKTALKSAGFYSAFVDDIYDDAAAVTGNGYDITFKQFTGDVDAAYTETVGSKTIGSVTYTLAYKVNSTFTPYYLGSVTSSLYTFTCYDNASDSVPVNKTASKNTAGFYNYDTLTKGDWYTIKTANTRDAVDSVIALKYGSCTPITNIEPVDTVVAAGTSSSSFSTSTVTLDGTAYGLAKQLIESHMTGYVNDTNDVYTLARTAASSGVTGADLFLDPYGYIFAATKSESTEAAVSDYAYIIDADVTATADTGNTFDKVEAKVEVLLDDGTYGVYDLAFKYKSSNKTYYSGNYAFMTGSSPMAGSAIEGFLKGNVFSYTLSDGVLTLVKEATAGTLSQQYTGVVGSNAANASIKIDGDTYSLSRTATELVYMNIADPASKSTVAAVGLDAAQTIPALTDGDPTTVFYVVDSTNASRIVKLITLGDYTASTNEEYIYLNEFLSSYQDDNDDWQFVYSYYTSDSDELQEITVDEDYDVGVVYALNSDGSLDILDNGSHVYYGTIDSIDDETLGITIDGEDDATYYLLAEGLEPIVVNDDLTYEPGAVVGYSTNTAGEISGLWVIADVPSFS